MNVWRLSSSEVFFHKAQERGGAEKDVVPIKMKRVILPLADLTRVRKIAHK